MWINHQTTKFGLQSQFTQVHLKHDHCTETFTQLILF